MNHKKQLVKNTIIIAIGKLSTQVISFLLLRLYTSKLSTAEYGTYDFLVTISVFLLPFITMLMEESLFRFLIDAETLKEKRNIVTATVLYMFISTICFSIIAGIVVSFIHYEYGLVFILFVVSNVMIAISNCLARGTGKIKLYSLSNFILGAITVILNILFIAVFNFGVSGLLWSNTIANALTSILVLIKLRFTRYIKIKYFNKKVLATMIKYSIPLVPNSISWTIITISDRIMLTSMVNADANGIYSIANKFPNIIFTCYGFFSTAWKESAARIIKEENKSQYYNSIYKDIKVFLKAITLGLIAIMPFIFPILIDKSYNDAYIYIPILIIAIYYSNISNFYGGIFSAYKDTKIMGSTTILAAIINIGINFLFITKYQIYAATFSTLISNLVVYVYRRIKLRKYIKLREKFNVLYWLLVLATLVTYYLNNMIVNILMFIIVLVYCIYTNKKFINRMINMLKNRNAATE